MRLLLIATLFLVACTAPNPDYDPTWEQRQTRPPDLSVAVDIAIDDMRQPADLSVTVDFMAPVDLRPSMPDLLCYVNGRSYNGLAPCGCSDQPCCYVPGDMPLFYCTETEACAVDVISHPSKSLCIRPDGGSRD